MSKKHLRVPELMVGFDTETTGLDVAKERAIAYGFCVYRFGRLTSTEHFFVVPDRPITAGARRVHGLSVEDIEARAPEFDVLSVEAGLTRAIHILRDLHAQGAHVVGANVVHFDLEMLRRSAISVLGRTLQDAEFDISLLRIIDVIEHDLAIEPRNVERPSRRLSQLCRHYGVTPGGHDALGDAVASVEVFLEQVVRNNAGQMPLALAMTLEEIDETVGQP
ncbi:MAG TPA: 3'-5' exonuclease [Acidimicrobiales bacterium]|nr:3'-5' exonuclease [Acidimicrobiales bacterium]